MMMENLTEPAEESFLRWRVSIEEDDPNLEVEEFGSEPLLKTRVRTQYISHLRRTLRKNLLTAKEKDDNVVEETLINKIVKGCTAHLEEKALKQCMIAKLYQRVMAQTIKDVKNATDECNLYTPLQEFAEHLSTLPVTKPVDRETQTDISNYLVPTQIADILSQTEAFVRKNIEQSREQSINGLPLSRIGCTNPINGISRPESQNFKNYSDPVHANFNGIEEKTVVNKRKMYDNQLNFADDEIAHTSSNAISKPETPLESSHPTSDVKTTNLTKSNTFEVRLRSPTFAESVALWYNLECEIEELPPAKKQKLEEKFVQLFGIDHAIDYYCLTNEQKSIACRKRIAKFVVIELTNFYVKKKIASKQLFKTLAKHITSVLLGRSLYPSPEEIKKSVEEFFLDDRVINSEDDFYF